MEIDQEAPQAFRLGTSRSSLTTLNITLKDALLQDQTKEGDRILTIIHHPKTNIETHMIPWFVHRDEDHHIPPMDLHIIPLIMLTMDLNREELPENDLIILSSNLNEGLALTSRCHFRMTIQALSMIDLPMVLQQQAGHPPDHLTQMLHSTTLDNQGHKDFLLLLVLLHRG